MNYTLEVIITVLEILKEKVKGVGQVSKDLENIASYCNGQVEAYESCIKLLKGLVGEDKCG